MVVRPLLYAHMVAPVEEGHGSGDGITRFYLLNGRSLHRNGSCTLVISCEPSPHLNCSHKGYSH